MAVEIQYVVVRKGAEKMTFASKKEADAYDKMLDLAEAFTGWFESSSLPLDEAQHEGLGLWLAENKDALQHILRTGKQPDAAAQADGSESAEKATKGKSAAKIRAVDAA